MGKAEFLGRALGRPTVTLVEDNYRQPSLEWFQIHRGNDEAGELLATFQMFEVIKTLTLIFFFSLNLISNSKNVSQLNDSEGTQDNIPPLPDARDPVVGAPADTGPILPVPKGIRPTLAKYR